MDEFDRQLDVIGTLGIATLTGISKGRLAESLEPLREVAATIRVTSESSSNRQSFVVVPDLGGRSAADLVPFMRLPDSERPGILDRNHGEAGLAGYAPLDVLQVPPGQPYLLVDIDRGDDFLGVRPRDAVASITGAGRTPLTITEGVMLQLVRPDLLQRNHCFMLAGSRRGDKRVPALWISDRAPKLGWCWEGNPHTWLGTASAGRRIAAKVPQTS